jgi:hypothetical protein
MFCLDIHAYETYRWAVAQKPDNHSGGSAYADGFSVLAEGPDVAILKTCAANGNLSFLGGRTSGRMSWA